MLLGGLGFLAAWAVTGVIVDRKARKWMKEQEKWAEGDFMAPRTKQSGAFSFKKKK